MWDKPMNNIIYDRYTFNKRDQEPTETSVAYVAVLRTLVKTCKYQALEEEMEETGLSWMCRTIVHERNSCKKRN